MIEPEGIASLLAGIADGGLVVVLIWQLYSNNKTIREDREWMKSVITLLMQENLTHMEAQVQPGNPARPMSIEPPE